MDTSFDPQPSAAVNIGMTVVDSSGREVGTVTAIQPRGTDVRPDTAAGVAEDLMSVGYIRIDCSGSLSNDTYAGGDQIADTAPGDPGVVTLDVSRDDLARTAS